MIAKAIYKYARISPKKCHNVAFNIRNIPAEDAVNILTYTPKKSAAMILNTLKSAIANAEDKHDLDISELVISKAVVNQGPTFKRFKARARGKGDMIRKRTSHIVIELDVSKNKEEDEDKTKKTEISSKSSNEAQPKESKSVEKKSSASSEVKTDEKYGEVFVNAPSEKDDLKKISGVGKVIEDKLNAQGIYFYKQIAKWNENNIKEFDNVLDFHGRIERDDWIKQAKELDKNSK